ncbi:hypothetical protein TNCV_2316351 [Trichonephila clavipes]|nr:hypothetical protein TNCV_2316351 [Trichonephila clavipes]
MARIIEIIPERDSKIRTVKLKTQHGTVLRPVQRAYPLEIGANENCVTEEVAGHSEFSRQSEVIPLFSCSVNKAFLTDLSRTL